MKEKVIFIFTTLQILFVTCIFAQNTSEQLTYFGRTIIFNKPAHYKELERDKIYLQRTNSEHVLPTLLRIVLKNNDQNLMIGLVHIPILYEPGNTKQDPGQMRDSLRQNLSYLNTMKSEQDTLLSKTRHVKKKHLRATKSDTGFIYQLKLETPFLDSYRKCQVLLLHKENVGNCYSYFFYNEGQEKLIDDIIQQNMKILAFRS